MNPSKRIVALAFLLSSCTAWAQNSVATASLDDQYVAGPDSQPQPDVPKGKTFEFTFSNSQIFPGTTRKITVYIPAEYQADKPACVYIGLDGLGSTPVVFDNLIHKHEMPVTIGIGITPGQVNSESPLQNPRFNRSFEFDGMNDNLARFVLQEVLTEVEHHKTPDNLPILLSKDPNDRAVGGFSTGGIGAFTLAWERPDAFRRVFTAIGTFVGMRGGDSYPVLIRKTEPKPIRIFMQDGSHDQADDRFGEVGDWWIGNQNVYSALRFAGYQVEHVWGEGSHNGKHGTAVFPDGMRWLWKDWPEPVTTGHSKNFFLQAVSMPGENWHLVLGNYQATGIMATDVHGNVVFRDAVIDKTWKIGNDEQLGAYMNVRGPYEGLAFGPNAQTYIADAHNATIAVSANDGKFRTLAKGIRGTFLAASHDGNIYVAEAGVRGKNSGKIWLVRPNGRKSQLDDALNSPAGVAISPDGLWLAVSENQTHWGYSYRIGPDGTVHDKQRFYWFHVPDSADDSGSGPLAMDREGRLYAATRMGVQVLDRNGRSRLIMPVPGGPVTGLTFGGVNFDTLYVSCADHKIYRRKIKTQGLAPGASPIQLPPWQAG